MADVMCDFQPHRRAVLEFEFGEPSSFSYLMGNTKPVCIDMTLCKISPVRCLFLGSGDIRNILYLIHTSPIVTEWEFDLVDSNPSIVARNFLFLQILNDETISVDALWNIWYDFVLDKNIFSYLHQLIGKININNLELIHENNRSEIAKVFQEWLILFKSIEKDKAIKQRQDHLIYCYKQIINMNINDYIKICCDEIKSVLINQNPAIIDEAEKEIKHYIEDGITKSMKNLEYINVTMLQPSSGFYTGHYGMHPYQGYFPFETIEEQEEFRRTTVNMKDPLYIYCKSQLEQWVKTYRQCRQKVKWHFWGGDALSLALFNMSLIEFDLIHTSNLCDHIGMLNILITCINLLRQRPWSRILTQSMIWRRKYARFSDYIQQLFNNVELGWFPSLIGLVCECTRVAGLEQYQKLDLLKNKLNMMDSFEYQTWRLATNIHLEPHLRLDGTDTNVLTILDKFAERCFYTHLTKSTADEGIGHSTTLTYYLFLRQYCQRCCVNADDAFEYLFQRTCNRYRAYSIGLHALRDYFTNINVHMYTSQHYRLTKINISLPIQIQTPVVEIVIIECDETKMENVLNAIRMDTFKEITRTSVMGNEISYDLCTGTITLLSEPQKQIKFHLIDDFSFKLMNKSSRSKNISLEFYMNLVHNAQIQFILPVCFSSPYEMAFLIDFHTWFPFGKFQLTNPIPICSKSASDALAIRDAVSSCYADKSDRQIYHSNVDKNKSTIQIVNAYETTSSFHVLIQIHTQQSTWNHTQHLTLSGHVLIVNIKFCYSDTYCLQLAFSCSLNMQESKFQQNLKKGTLNMILVKNTVELLSLTTFIRDSNTVLFDSTKAKRWPPPRLAKGQLLQIGMNFPSPMVIGDYDTETMIVYDALFAMFTFPEMQLLRHESGAHLFQDVDFDLRETIRQIYLIAYCGRQRVFFYTSKFGQSHSINDIRTLTDILFLCEGVYYFSDRPVIAVSYLDMKDIKDADVIDLTRYIRNLIITESKAYTSAIAQIQSPPNASLNNANKIEIKATKDELELMRQFLVQNGMKTKGTHRNNLYGPWHASFIGTLPADFRSLLHSTKLTREHGINIEKNILDQFKCYVCKKIPTDPNKPWPKCSRCKRTNYCSIKCQAEDWNTHKKTCQNQN